MIDINQIILTIVSAGGGILVAFIKSKFVMEKDLLSFCFEEQNVFKNEFELLYFDKIRIKNHGKNVLSDLSIILDKSEYEKNNSSMSIVTSNIATRSESDHLIKIDVKRFYPSEEIVIGIKSSSQVDKAILKRVCSNECVARLKDEVKTTNDYINDIIVYVFAGFAGIGVFVTSMYAVSLFKKIDPPKSSTSISIEEKKSNVIIDSSNVKDIKNTNLALSDQILLVMEDSNQRVIAGETAKIKLIVQNKSDYPLFDAIADINIQGFGMNYKKFHEINVIRPNDNGSISTEINVPKEYKGLNCQGVINLRFSLNNELVNKTKLFSVLIN